MNGQLLSCMEGIKRKQAASFELLYLLTKDRLRFFLLSKGLRGEDLAEILSDCYVVVFEKAWRFRGDSEVLTWIFGIVDRKCREFFRKQKNQPTAFLEVPDRRDFEGLSALSMDLRAAVETLDCEKYSIFVYKLCFRLTYEQIAKHLGIPVGTLKRNVSEIRTQLQLRLKEAD